MNNAALPVTSGNHTPLHEHITDVIIRQMEAGNIPWQNPWNRGNINPLRIPFNFTTGKKYQGINIFLLWSSAVENNHDTNEWASFKQWQQKGETVRKGEKGTMIIYYDTFEKEVEGETKKIPFLKSSYVFNKSQLVDYVPQEKPERKPFETTKPAVLEFVINTGARIDNEDYGACYFYILDKICMPYYDDFLDTETRTKEEGYYTVLMHELTHWTGHSSRLDRKLNNKRGSEGYAAEEMVAEFGAAFLCAELGIYNEPAEDHAAYIATWLQRVRDNKQHLIKAASEATKAVTYLQSLQPVEKSLTPG